MRPHLRGTFLALISVAFGNLAWGQAPTAPSQTQESEATRNRTAQGKGGDQEQLVNKCVEKVKADDEGIPDYQARKACREHVRKQSDDSSGG